MKERKTENYLREESFCCWSATSLLSIIIFTFTCCAHNWLAVMCRLFSARTFHYLTARLQGSEVMDEHKAQSPLLGHTACRKDHWDCSLQCVHTWLYWVPCWSQRSTTETELSCSRHVLPRKKKVVKTCRFPAACGLPIGSGAERQHQPHSGFGSVKTLFTKVKHIASPWVKGVLWQKSGSGSDWAELCFGFCKPATITDPLDWLPLVNSRFFSSRAPVEQLIMLNYCTRFAEHISFFSLSL